MHTPVSLLQQTRATVSVTVAHIFIYVQDRTHSQTCINLNKDLQGVHHGTGLIIKIETLCICLLLSSEVVLLLSLVKQVQSL